MTNLVGVGVHFNVLVLLASDLNRWRDMGLTNLCVHRSASGEGRQSVALAGWGSSGLISNQADMMSLAFANYWLAD